MRVISKFRDYDDGVRAIDRDDEPLYVRETRNSFSTTWRSAISTSCATSSRRCGRIGRARRRRVTQASSVL
jgi:hypothetical protein